MPKFGLPLLPAMQLPVSATDCQLQASNQLEDDLAVCWTRPAKCSMVLVGAQRNG